jgi:hypothetical protein
VFFAFEQNFGIYYNLTLADQFSSLHVLPFSVEEKWFQSFAELVVAFTSYFEV